MPLSNKHKKMNQNDDNNNKNNKSAENQLFEMYTIFCRLFIYAWCMCLPDSLYVCLSVCTNACNLQNLHSIFTAVICPLIKPLLCFFFWFFVNIFLTFWSFHLNFGILSSLSSSDPENKNYIYCFHAMFSRFFLINLFISFYLSTFLDQSIRIGRVCN